MIEGDSRPSDVFEEAYPCEDCWYAPRCRIYKLSCKSFHIYSHSKGRLDKSQRIPSSYWYHKTFLKRNKTEPTEAEIEAIAAKLIPVIEV